MFLNLGDPIKRNTKKINVLNFLGEQSKISFSENMGLEYSSGR